MLTKAKILGILILSQLSFMSVKADWLSDLEGIGLALANVFAPEVAVPLDAAFVVSNGIADITSTWFGRRRLDTDCNPHRLLDQINSSNSSNSTAGLIPMPGSSPTQYI